MRDLEGRCSTDPNDDRDPSEERSDRQRATAGARAFGGFAHYSPYIVVDHMALTSNLNLLKDVIASKRFVTIVPAAAVQALDKMKRSETGARNAIR